MTDNTRKLLDAAAAVLGLPPGLPPFGERRHSDRHGLREVTGYSLGSDGEMWVQYRCCERPGVGGAMLDAWNSGTLADAQPEPAPDALPRIVEWADLQPGDLALDVRAKHGQVWHGGKGKGGSWRDEDGTRRSGSRDGIGRKYANSAQAVLIARNVPKRASAIRAAYEAMRDRALEVGKSIPRRGA